MRLMIFLFIFSLIFVVSCSTALGNAKGETSNKRSSYLITSEMRNRLIVEGNWNEKELEETLEEVVRDFRESYNEDPRLVDVTNWYDSEEKEGDKVCYAVAKNGKHVKFYKVVKYSNGDEQFYEVSRKSLNGNGKGR